MKQLIHDYFLGICILILACGLLAACSTQSANLTTTETETAATVDNAGTIAEGAAVTSANTAAGTTVATITGTNVTLSVPALATGTVVATFKNTVAVQFAGDIKSYTQTAALMGQQILPQITALAGNVSAIDSLITSTASSWGLTPVNASQASTLKNIGTIASKVGSDATALTNLLTGISVTGTVTSAPTTTTFYFHPTIRAPYGCVKPESAFDLSLARD